METIDINKMRAAGRLAYDTLMIAGSIIKPGITTGEIDRIVHNYTVQNGGKPAPLNYKGFPKSCCTSVNDVVCHGIPGPYLLQEGDIVNVDVTTILDGHFGDCNMTFCVGEVGSSVKEFVHHSASAMWQGIHTVRPGIFLNDIGRAIQSYAEKLGYSVVREFGGHGIGRIFHDSPHVSHFDTGVAGPVLKPGDIFTIEPMICMGQPDIYIEPDGWTVKTRDGSWSSQFENTVLVTDDGFEVLTRVEF
jgi:methionyl aminopeptidase